MIGGAAQHHPVDALRQMRLGLVQRADAAVDHDGQVRAAALQPVDDVVVERGDVPVFLGAEALQPGLAGVDHKGRHPGLVAAFDQSEQALVRILLVHPDAALDGGRHSDGCGDGGHALGHQIRLAHQAGAETAALHPVRRAADVQVDLDIAHVLANAGGLGQFGGIRAAELQGDGLLERIEPEQPLAIPMDHRPRRQHLGIEQRPTRQAAMERPAVPVGPVHHRRDAEPMALVFRHVSSDLKGLGRGE